MKLEPITGIDEFEGLIGVTLKHPGDRDTTDYRVAEFDRSHGVANRTAFRIDYRRPNHQPVEWMNSGWFYAPSGLCRVIPDFLPYDPKQQGDTDDDI